MDEAPQRVIHAVDLFCGIGGLTHGLARSGITVKAGIDIDPSCRYPYEANNPDAQFTAADVRDVSFGDIAKHYEGADVSLLAGCAPCQPFSAHTRKTANSKADDCSLLEEFSRLIREGQPDIVSMENVPGLRRHDAFQSFLLTLAKLGYDTKHGMLSCVDYGVPQSRKRLVLLASRLGRISLPPAGHRTANVADYIVGLPEILDGEADPDDPLHVTLPLSDLNKERIRQSAPGGSWKDWDTEIVSDCHKTAHYPASYGRMRWDAPAPTITTQFCYYSTGRFGHPEEDRAISLREGALLQTFPRDYEFLDRNDTLIIRQMARHIGNAVPVKLGEAIGNSILEAENV